jgi:hypothetical protein
MFVRSSWQGSTTPEDSSNVFYNARVSIQDPATLTPLVYVDNRASSVLDNPADYRAAVVRFSVPCSQIPLFFYESTVSLPPCPPGGESIVRITNTLGPPLTAAVELVLESTDANNPLNPAITQVAQYLSMLNYALGLAATSVAIAPPSVYFDPATQLFRLEGTAPVATYKIEVSYPIARLFGAISLVTNISYPYSGPNTGFFEWAAPSIVVRNAPVTVFGSTQEYSTYSKWQSLRNISFQVFGVPTTSEYLSSSSGVRVAGQGVEAGADLVSFVLTDFEPLAGSPDRGVIQFFPQGPLRWYNLLGNIPLRAITIQVLYTDERGVTRPVRVGYEDVFTLKLEFRRRELNLT